MLDQAINNQPSQLILSHQSKIGMRLNIFIKSNTAILSKKSICSILLRLITQKKRKSKSWIIKKVKL